MCVTLCEQRMGAHRRPSRQSDPPGWKGTPGTRRPTSTAFSYVAAYLPRQCDVGSACLRLLTPAPAERGRQLSCEP
jgi:hypothetical protein